MAGGLNMCLRASAADAEAVVPHHGQPSGMLPDDLVLATLEDAVIVSRGLFSNRRSYNFRCMTCGPPTLLQISKRSTRTTLAIVCA